MIFKMHLNTRFLQHMNYMSYWGKSFITLINNIKHRTFQKKLACLCTKGNCVNGKGVKDHSSKPRTSSTPAALVEADRSRSTSSSCSWVRDGMMSVWQYVFPTQLEMSVVRFPPKTRTFRPSTSSMVYQEQSERQQQGTKVRFQGTRQQFWLYVALSISCGTPMHSVLDFMNCLVSEMLQQFMCLLTLDHQGYPISLKQFYIQPSPQMEKKL